MLISTNKQRKLERDLAQATCWQPGSATTPEFNVPSRNAIGFRQACLRELMKVYAGKCVVCDHQIPKTEDHVAFTYSSFYVKLSSTSSRFLNRSGIFRIFKTLIHARYTGRDRLLHLPVVSPRRWRERGRVESEAQKEEVTLCEKQIKTRCEECVSDVACVE